jgi:cell wall-associated NlpC family hydrolase
VRRSVLGVLVVALAAPGFARAGLSPVEVLSGGATVRGGGGGAAFLYPVDGTGVEAGSVEVAAGRVVVRDLSVLQGRIRIDRLEVPPSGTGGARVEGLEVLGHRVDARANMLVPLGGRDYAIVLQAAALAGGTKVGVVGLRVVLGDVAYGFPAGTEFLIGLGRAAAPTTAEASADASTAAVLGLDFLPNRPTGVAIVNEPLLGPTTQGERAVMLVQRYLGVPYVWGGAAPSGFDCSGLVMYVYAQLGVQLPHFSGSQWQSGTRVEWNELQPGDIVFFDMGPTGPGHEGIYIGNGQFVHAPHTGDVVKISSLLAGSYSRRYVGAVRPY